MNDEAIDSIILCVLMMTAGMACAEEGEAMNQEEVDWGALLALFGIGEEEPVVQPSITEEYWNMVRTGGEVEARYTALGEYAVKKTIVPLDDAQVVDYVIVYPEELETTDQSWPMVLFVNGSNDPTMARRIDADHTDMMVVSDGYLTAWFCWFLKGDAQALAAFGGENPELLCNTSNWQDVRIKNLK